MSAGVGSVGQFRSYQTRLINSICLLFSPVFVFFLPNKFNDLSECLTAVSFPVGLFFPESRDHLYNQIWIHQEEDTLFFCISASVSRRARPPESVTAYFKLPEKQTKQTHE